MAAHCTDKPDRGITYQVTGPPQSLARADSLGDLGSHAETGAGPASTLMQTSFLLRINCARKHDSNASFAISDLLTRIRGGRLDVNARNEFPGGLVLLGCAAAFGMDREVEELLALGADINRINEQHSGSALHAAASYGHVSTAELLLSRGAAINARGAGALTPLHFAVLHGHSDVADLLLCYGAQIDARDRGGATALISAISLGEASMVKLLLLHGADLHSSVYGDTLLAFAAGRRVERLSIVAMLLAAGADLLDGGGA